MLLFSPIPQWTNRPKRRLSGNCDELKTPVKWPTNTFMLQLFALKHRM